MHNALPQELGFIHQFRVDHRSVKHPAWLKSAFDDNIWLCEFGSIKRSINFHKKLDDGSLLTAFKNTELLHSMKLFLCIQTHPSLTGAINSNDNTNAGKVMIALHLLDYFLVRSTQFQLGKYGFGRVSADDVVALVDVLTTHRRPKESVYRPLDVISEHLNGVTVSEEDLDNVRRQDPELLRFNGEQEHFLNPQKTLAARAWLKMNGFYIPGSDCGTDECRLRVARNRLLDALMGDSVLAPLRFMKLRLPGLDIEPIGSFARELLPVPVNNIESDERASAELTSSYLFILRSMKIANQQGAKLLSDAALEGIDAATLLLKERTKERARFTSLPFSLANYALGKAIGFYIEYAEPLVDFYLKLAESGENPSTFSLEIPPKLRELGVVDWRENTGCSTTFFTELRGGCHLFNMLEVLWGAIAVIVGTLSARRVSELESLTAASIVEEHGSFFVAIDLRKANIGQHRAKTLRPIPQIAAEALMLLSRVSSTLERLGFSVGGRLFEFPYSSWKKAPPHFGTNLPDLSRCFDRFCDFYQTECDEQGRRYYIRTHQLRRNFALLFFWNGSFGGIEVLRHFLGHSKPSMTYRYITEAVSGKVLRQVKANVAKDLIRKDDAAVEDLSSFICSRYGISVNDLHVLPEADVATYVEDLLFTGEAEIEPEFFTGPRGEEFRITYKIKPIRQELMEGE